MAELAIAEPDWLAKRRERAASLSGELGLPEFKGVPGWEFTELTGLELDGFERASGSAPAPDSLLLEPPSGEPEGAVVMTLAEAAASEEYGPVVERYFGTIVPRTESDPFVARNEAEWTEGAFVYVPKGVKVEVPVELHATVRAGEALHWRTMIVVEEGAEAEVWEQYLSAEAEGEGLLNTVVELVVGENATLRYVCGQQLNEDSWVFGTQRAEVAAHGTLDWAAIGFGGKNGKVRMETKLAGEGAEGKVTGAYAGLRRQHLDFDTLQEHAAPHTTSDLAFRGVLQNRATAVWRGMIKVDPGAQRTDAFQESRNLLLSKRSHADAIPGLEIEANDVRCTHAAAVAQVDRDQLYYLMSRGLPREVATRLVIEGFLQELVERFEEGPVREQVGGALERRLNELLGA